MNTKPTSSEAFTLTIVKAVSRVDSRLLALQLGNQHKNVRELLERHKADFMELGVLRFKTSKSTSEQGDQPENQAAHLGNMTFGQLPFKKEVADHTYPPQRPRQAEIDDPDLIHLSTTTLKTPKRNAVRIYETRTAIKKNIQSNLSAPKIRANCASSASDLTPCRAQPGSDIGPVLTFFSWGCSNFHRVPVLRCGTVILGASNTTKLADNLPDSEVFSRPESFGFGRDGLVRKAGRTTNFVLLTSRPPVARSKAVGGFQSQLGAEAMTTTPPEMGTLGTTPATSPSPLSRQQAIENALSAALYFIRQPHSTKTLQAAAGRANRAASMLNQASAESTTSGRA